MPARMPPWFQAAEGPNPSLGATAAESNPLLQGSKIVAEDALFFNSRSKPNAGTAASDPLLHPLLPPRPAWPVAAPSPSNF